MNHRVIHGDALAVLDGLEAGSVRGVVTSPPYNLRNSAGHGFNSGPSGKWKSAKLNDGYEGGTMEHRLIEGDALTEMDRMADGSVKGVVTSPPYNLNNTTGSGMRMTSRNRWKSAESGEYEAHPDNMPHAEYVAWQRAVLGQCMRVIEPDGAIFYNHKWRQQDGVLQDRADIMEGFPVRQIIIWDRGGGFNFNDAYFLPSFEVIYLVAKPGFRLPPGLNRLRDVWRINPEGNNDHPAPYPVDLASRCVRALGSGPVLDPFLGSGTTAVAAERNGVDSIGIEKSAKYCAQARARIAEAQAKGRLF